MHISFHQGCCENTASTPVKFAEHLYSLQLETQNIESIESSAFQSTQILLTAFLIHSPIKYFLTGTLCMYHRKHFPCLFPKQLSSYGEAVGISAVRCRYRQRESLTTVAMRKVVCFTRLFTDFFSFSADFKTWHAHSVFCARLHW